MPDVLNEAGEVPEAPELPICVGCRDSIDPNVQRVADAVDSSGQTRQVHMFCGERCTRCDLRYVTGWRSAEFGVRFWDVENRATCQWCYERWCDTYPEEDRGSCDVCSTYALYRNLYTSHINNDQSICGYCYDQEYQCGDCDEWYVEDDGHSCDYEEYDNRSNRGLVYNYSYKPDPIFWGTGKYFFGVELEVEAMDADYHEGARVIKDHVGNRAYLKSDGSITNGFEIVTHPHSLEEFQTKFPWQGLDDLKNLGFRSWNTRTCGLHVHVSRTAFNSSTKSQRETHEIKFIKLIYDNKEHVQKLAGRKSSWAKFDDKGKIVRKVKYGEQSAARYSAVNIQPMHTIEVRVFKGSLRKERVLAAVEFVHAAVEYTRDLPIVPKNNPFAWSHFLGFVMSNSSTYPNLCLIINEMLAKSQVTISRQEETV